MLLLEDGIDLCPVLRDDEFALEDVDALAELDVVFGPRRVELLSRLVEPGTQVSLVLVGIG